MRRAEHISRRLKLRHLRVLVAAVEQKSMVKAAEYLAVSQPVVSKAIADLEDMLGLRLLDRGPGGIEPTIYGRALLKHSTAIFDNLRTGINELEFLADPGAGELKVGTTESMATTLVPAILDRMSQQYPRVTYEITIGSPSDLRDRGLRSRRVDLVVGSFVPEEIDFDVTMLYRDKLCIVVSATDPLARRRKVTLADLVNVRWALPAPDHLIASFIIDMFRRAGLEPPKAAATVTSAPCTSCLVATGRYVGVLGSVFLELSGSRASLRALPVELPRNPWPVSIATLRDRTPNPVAKLFIDAAKELTKPLEQRGLRRRRSQQR
jgi:DNA-binding transcriptional LysR family regulator